MSKEKAKLMKMILKYRDAFSLRDEIGACPNLTADIKVIDESPFFVRPFPLSEADKGFRDEQMVRLVSLGILSKISTSHSSPVMLITRKPTNDEMSCRFLAVEHENLKKKHVHLSHERCTQHFRQF